MPIVRENKYTVPYLIYDAPVNEKTKQVREMFNVDPESGYPRHYSWRNLAKLGPEYTTEKAFNTLVPFKPEAMYTTYFCGAAGALLTSCVLESIYSMAVHKPFLAKPWVLLTTLSISAPIAVYTLYKTPVMQAVEDSAYVDYANTYPERFGTKKRVKHREVLMYNDLIR